MVVAKTKIWPPHGGGETKNWPPHAGGEKKLASAWWWRKQTIASEKLPKTSKKHLKTSEKVSQVVRMSLRIIIDKAYKRK